MPTNVEHGGIRTPLKELFVKIQGNWTLVHHSFVYRAGAWVLTHEAVAVAMLSQGATNVEAKSLFPLADWTNPNKKKRLIIPSGVIVGATSTSLAALRTGSDRQGPLEIVVDGEVQGAGGATSGAAGGAAINIEQSGVTVLVNGAVRGGGGAGGKGGTGGGGSYTSTMRQPTSGDYYDIGSYQWGVNSGTMVVWAGSVVYSTGSGSPITSVTVGSYTYYRTTTHGNVNYYGVYRTYQSTTNTNGGAGGDGGRGRGYDGAKEAGDAGSNGGTNAGRGGTGGTGGTWGDSGDTGATGASGNRTAGTAGSAGGAAGPAITGLARTVVNTGTINGTY